LDTDRNNVSELLIKVYNIQRRVLKSHYGYYSLSETEMTLDRPVKGVSGVDLAMGWKKLSKSLDTILLQASLPSWKLRSERL